MRRITVEFTVSSWVPNLPKRVKQVGFHLVEFERQQFQNNLINVCTNTHLLALHEILQGLRQSCPWEGILEHEIALHGLLSAERRSIIYNWSPTVLLCQSPPKDVISISE